MTRTTNARLAGVTYLVYLAAGIASLVLAGRAHATDVLAVLTSFSALVLGVTLYAITREQDPDLAMLGLTCRVIEAIPGEGMIYFAVGWHDLRLAPPPRPDDSHRTGLAWRACGGPARRDPSPAARRTVRRRCELVVLGHLAHVVTDVGVRSGARAVAAHQRRGRASRTAQSNRRLTSGCSRRRREAAAQLNHGVRLASPTGAISNRLLLWLKELDSLGRALAA